MKKYNNNEVLFYVLLVCILTAAGYFFSYGSGVITLVCFFIGVSVVGNLRYEKIISQKNREIAELTIQGKTNSGYQNKKI